MKTLPYFSIIIPVYNVALYLRECLDSVLNQTFADWECLCVDDGSKDASGDILDEYARRDSRFRIFHQRNGGVSAARNRALDGACGIWVWFVDGDDGIRSDALELLRTATIVGDGNAEAISFEMICGGVFLRKWTPLGQSPVITSEQTLDLFWRFRGAAWRTLFCRRSIGVLRFEPYGMGEDMLFSLIYFFKTKRWVVWKEAFYFYRVRQGSATHVSPSLKNVCDWLTVQREILGLLLVDENIDKIGGGQRVIISVVCGTILLYKRGDILSITVIGDAGLLYCMDRQSAFVACNIPVSFIQAYDSFCSHGYPFASVGAYDRCVAALESKMVV